MCSVSLLLHVEKKWRRCLSIEQVGGAKYCNFLTQSYKFPTEDIMGAQNFNFVRKFMQNRVFSPKFGIFKQKFSHEKKIFGQTKL